VRVLKVLAMADNGQNVGGILHLYNADWANIGPENELIWETLIDAEASRRADCQTR
jgi:hypothetical protein